MKSLNDIIQYEYFDQRDREVSERAEKVHEARDELDALLQQAGIKDGPENVLTDDAADKWRDENYYRLRVREMVFNEPDGELRRQIMRALDHYRSELWLHGEMLSLFDGRFALGLKQVRCSPPRETGIEVGVLGGVVIMCLVYWFSGALNALVVGVGVVLPVLMFRSVHRITALWQHALTYGEAVKIVERNEAKSKAEATRRLYLPKLFSLREKRTGEPDAAEGN